MRNLLMLFLLLTSLASNAQVGIGVVTSAMETSAQLEVKSTTKGLLPPRMTFEQRAAITAPAAGLQVWCTNCGLAGEMQVFNGVIWTNMVGGAASLIPTAPVITTTLAASNITTTSAASGGTISSDGGSAITQRGVCWSTSPNPTTNDTKTIESGTTGTYVSNLAGLSVNTSYYARAYAVNAVGTSYGEEMSFTTLSVPPVITIASISTAEISGITSSSAISGGMLNSNGGADITAQGVCWSTSYNPTIADQKTSDAITSSYASSLTGLDAGTTYYVRAYATNSAGTAYGNATSFTTLATLPVISTTNISGISYTMANSGGSISSYGGVPVIEQGICWGTVTNPTTADSKTIEYAPSPFTSSMTGLSTGTTYYVRAYARNSAGTSYGNELSFATTSTIPSQNSTPVLGTKPVIKADSNYVSGGYISSNGGSAITSQGICWNENGNPTINDSVVYHTPTGVGYFTTSFSLPKTCGQNYYVRSFAINSHGISYGQQSVIASGLRTLFSALSISGIESTSAISNINITSDGGCAVTERGVCWSLSEYPTTSSNFKVINGDGTGTYSCNLNSLTPNYTYYVRAYAITATGTHYSNQEVITTANSQSLYIGQHYAGGIIFYLDQTGQHGLVCHEVLQSNMVYISEGNCNSSDLTSTSTAVGTGAQNTAIIIAACTAEHSSARTCDDLIENGYSDWFLPSLNELKLINTNLTPLGTIWEGVDYLSSSLSDSGGFYTIQFSNYISPYWWDVNGNNGNVQGTGTTHGYFRAVRAF